MGHPKSVDLGALLAALPPLAALAYGPWGTTLVAGAALILVNSPFTSIHHAPVVRITAFALCVLSVAIAASRARHDAQLVNVRLVAEAAQRGVLRPPPPVIGQLRCGALYRAAQHGTLVGGDLYDVLTTSRGVRAVVADVQGHGISAVGTVAALLGTFREAALDETDLGGIAGRLDRRLGIEADLRGDEPGELFATAVLIEFDQDASRARLISCGHPSPLLIRDGAAEEVSTDHAPPLGLGLTHTARVHTLALRPGDVLLAYTDGVTEARDAQGDFYPLRDRVRHAEPTRLVTAVWKDLSGYTSAIDDDVALLALSPQALPGHRARRPGTGWRRATP
ncbi:PP2C family protein-serine/threonine phosphatase [Streptomyces diastatochromogenes]|nr:PP2C family protein-serine/threonine phosphatase [Streptomyces diastatochromogenes]